MTALAGKEAMKSLERVRATERARAKQTKALRDSWVLDGELNAEQLREHHAQLRADFYARNPGLAA
jgi:polyhydroxyalkanoate synthesis regulator phasin